MVKHEAKLSNEDLTVEEQRAQIGPATKRRPWASPLVRYQGRKIIVLGAIAVALVPAVALAKGPIVRVTESAWAAILKFFGL